MLPHLQSLLGQMKSHYGAQAAGKTGALGQLPQEVEKEEWMDNLMTRYRGQEKGAFRERLDHTWDRETKMGVSTTSESLFKAESKSFMGDLQARISMMQAQITPPGTPRGKIKIRPSTPVKAAATEPHKLINWHKPMAAKPKTSAAVQKLRKQLHKAVDEGDMDMEDKLRKALAFARPKVPKPHLILKPKFKKGGAQPRARTHPDDGDADEKKWEDITPPPSPGSRPPSPPPLQLPAAAAAAVAVAPIVPKQSRYVATDSIKLKQRLRLKTSYGDAPAVNVGTRQHFATSFGGLAHRERVIPLVYGQILTSGHNARITITKRAGGDISTISTFIKTFFLTGGSIKKKRMSSQQLVAYIMRHLPGTFSITA